MNTLVIRHVEASHPPQFQLVRLADGKPAGPPVPVVSPVGFPVEGRPQSDLDRELRWYLEDVLIAYREAPPAERTKMRAIWEQAGLPDLEWPDEPT